MHDCVKTKERLVDLVFGELDSEAGRLLLRELQSCHDCLAEYRSMTETLELFDEAIEKAMPDESYWLGYESGLRARLQHAQPRLTQRLVAWIKSFGLLSLRPLPLMAGAAIVMVAVGWWWMWRSAQIVVPVPSGPQIVTTTPTPQPRAEAPDKTIAVAPKPENGLAKRHSGHFKTTGSHRRLPVDSSRELDEESIAGNSDPVRFEQTSIVSSIFAPETIRHFEKTQLLLRSFRNAAVATDSDDGKSVDVTYEKQMSRRLLYQNILLRRNAEMKGNLPAEEALNSIEPFLLDIANLPDRPSSDDLDDIRERLQRRELIAALQVYSAQPSLPTYQSR